MEINSWMLACGVCPVPGARGFDRVLAAADGVTEKAIERRREHEPELIQPFDEFLTAPADGWQPFEVKLGADDRYSPTVWINAATQEQAVKALLIVGIVAVDVASKTKTEDLPKMSPFEVMAQRGALIRQSADAYALYPCLFVSPAQARKAFQRAESEWDKITLTTPKPHIEEYSYMGFGGRETKLSHSLRQPVQVTYKPAAPKHKPRTAMVWPHRLDGFRAELEAAIGPLDVYEVAAFAQPATPTVQIIAMPTRIIVDGVAMQIPLPVGASAQWLEAARTALSKMVASGDVRLE